MSLSTVVAVTVTYGNRINLLSQMLSAAAGAGIKSAIVVCNGCSPDVVDSIRQFDGALGMPRVSVVIIEVNAGSAGGFAAGLNAAIKSGATLAWLLDDDNAALPDALANSLSRIERDGSDSDVAVVSYRRNLRPHRELRDGFAVEDVYPQAGSFLNFDSRKRVAVGRVPRTTEVSRAEVLVPMAPYGGLLLRTSLLGEIDLPDPDLVLYEDDHEFTSRLRASGVQLVLLFSSRVEDVDEGSGPDRSGSGLIRLLRTPAADRGKMLYQVRNSVYLDRQRAASLRDKLWLLLNGVVYVSTVALMSVAKGENRPNTRLILTAMAAGWRGRLGKAVELI